MAPLDRINGLDGVNRSQTIYNNRRVESRSSDDAPNFSLPMDDDGGVLYEPSKPKEAEKTLAQKKEENLAAVKKSDNLNRKFDGPGVKIELSTAGVETLEKEHAPGIIDRIKTFVDGIRAFLSSVWNGTDAVVDASTEETESLSEEVYEEELISPPINLELKNDPESIASFMVNYGGRHLAKNSDLLTQYDRKGQITSPNPSDRRKILQGDRGVTEL